MTEYHNYHRDTEGTERKDGDKDEMSVIKEAYDDVLMQEIIGAAIEVHRSFGLGGEVIVELKVLDALAPMSSGWLTA
jgi:hypothetical protein